MKRIDVYVEMIVRAFIDGTPDLKDIFEARVKESPDSRETLIGDIRFANLVADRMAEGVSMPPFAKRMFKQLHNAAVVVEVMHKARRKYLDKSKNPC